MNWIRQLRLRFGAVFRKQKLDAEMSDELRHHLELRIERNIAAGMSPEEARYAALRSFGGVEQIKEQVRFQRGFVWLDHGCQDLRYALRSLRKSPGFTFVAVLSLALGIGANTAIFSLLNDVLLRALPVKDPQDLVLFNWLEGKGGGRPISTGGWRGIDPGTGRQTSGSFSLLTFQRFHDDHPALASVFAFFPLSKLNVNVDGHAEIIGHSEIVSGDYHSGLGLTAAAGRMLTPADDRAAADPVVVISYRWWQVRFGGNPTVIGKTILIEDMPYTIVGVTPPNFQGTLQVGEAVDLTMTLSRWGNNALPDDLARPSFWWLRIMARLKPGITKQEALASLEGTFQGTAREGIKPLATPIPGIKPMTDLPDLRIGSGAKGLTEARNNYARTLRLLTGLVGLVLLVACANVANLLLARGAARRREIAVRIALGASRSRVIRQLLTESTVLALLGSAVGIALALLGGKTLLALTPFADDALILNPTVDLRVLGFTVALALVTALLFGLAPALRATRLDLSSEFQGGTRTLRAGSRSLFARTLMIVQVALSLILLISAGLFVRTLRNLERVDIGFNRQQLLLFEIDASSRGLTIAQSVALNDRIADRLDALPGVRHVAFSSMPLLSGGNWTDRIFVPGYLATGKTDINVSVNAVSPDFFSTMEIPLLFGRDFAARDNAATSKVAIVNQAFARKYFGDENVVGHRVGFWDPKLLADMEIIGVLRDSKYSNIKSAPPPTIYLPYAQKISNFGDATFEVRFAGALSPLISSIRDSVNEIYPNRALFSMRTQDDQIGGLFTQERMFARLCSFFGFLALGLAAIGLYGLMSYIVLLRRSEIGVRMALGALPRWLLWMVLRESLTLVSTGVLFGLVGAVAAVRLFSNLLFALSPTDPFTYGAMGMLLVAVALIASWLPARRAAKVDPMVALRCE